MAACAIHALRMTYNNIFLTLLLKYWWYIDSQVFPCIGFELLQQTHGAVEMTIEHSIDIQVKIGAMVQGLGYPQTLNYIFF